MNQTLEALRVAARKFAEENAWVDDVVVYSWNPALSQGDDVTITAFWRKIMRQALSHKNQPAKISLVGALVIWLLLDKYQPPGWVWGVVMTLVGLVLLVQFVDAVTAKSVEIFAEDPPQPERD